MIFQRARQHAQGMHRSAPDGGQRPPSMTQEEYLIHNHLQIKKFNFLQGSLSGETRLKGSFVSSNGWPAEKEVDGICEGSLPRVMS